MSSNPFVNKIMQGGDPASAAKALMCGAIVCGIMPLIIASVFCGMYWSMWA